MYPTNPIRRNARTAAAIAGLLFLLSFVMFVGHLLKSLGIDTQAFLHVVTVLMPFILAVSFLLLGVIWLKDFQIRSELQAFFETLLITATDFVSSLLIPSAPPPRARQGATG